MDRVKLVKGIFDGANTLVTSPSWVSDTYWMVKKSALDFESAAIVGMPDAAMAKWKLTRHLEHTDEVMESMLPVKATNVWNTVGMWFECRGAGLYEILTDGVSYLGMRDGRTKQFDVSRFMQGAPGESGGTILVWGFHDDDGTLSREHIVGAIMPMEIPPDVLKRLRVPIE